MADVLTLSVSPPTHGLWRDLEGISVKYFKTLPTTIYFSERSLRVRCEAHILHTISIIHIYINISIYFIYLDTRCIVYTIHIYKCVYRILLYVACSSDKKTNVYTGKIKKNKKISKNIASTLLPFYTVAF